MKRIHVRVIRVSLVVVLAVFCIAIFQSKSEPYLMERATHVPGYETAPDEYTGDWGWLSDHELQFVTTTEQVVRVDVNSGRVSRTPLPSTVTSWLNVKLNTLIGPHSPDGKLILYFSHANPRNHYLMDISTGKPVKVTGPGIGWPHWSPDSQGWMEVAGTFDYVVYRSPEFKPQLYKTQQNTGNMILWYDGKDRFVGCESSGNGQRQTKVFETTLGNPTTTRNLPVNLPQEASVMIARLSPKGDRVLWWLQYPRKPVTWINQLSLWLKGKSAAGPLLPYTEGIAISKPDGSEMREIGRIGTLSDPEVLHAVQWMPDGKRICVRYKDGLYTLHVD